ncbi:DnaJ (Hsp40), sub C, member 17 [Dimargaris xerosporica]|nr:DnaJ (Hsp40), sub C, member 17 [Dimargaris xerosporica]
MATAESQQDHYAILGVTAQSTVKEITKAYRLKARDCHPDKNPNDASAAKRFHAVSVAYEVLTDPSQKLTYDQRLQATAARRQRHDAMTGQRRKMKEELERAEREARDKHQAAQTAKTNAAREAAEAHRQGLARQQHENEAEARRREQQRARKVAQEAVFSVNEPNWLHSQSLDGSVQEIDRSIIASWSKKGPAYHERALRTLFKSFGPIDHVVLTPDRPRRALIVYHSVVSAYSAVTNSTNPDFTRFQLKWASGKQPEMIARIEKDARPFTASTRQPMPPAVPSAEANESTTQASESCPPTHSASPSTHPAPAPTFSSFPSFENSSEPCAHAIDPKALPLGDYETLTFIRLRQHERQRLNEHITAQEAALDQPLPPTPAAPVPHHEPISKPNPAPKRHRYE